MGKRIQFKIEDSEYKELKEIKDDYGLTWKGMVVRGANDITDGDY